MKLFDWIMRPIWIRKEKYPVSATTVKVRTDPMDDRWTRTFNEMIALIVSILIPVGALVAGAQADLGQNSLGKALTRH